MREREREKQKTISHDKISGIFTVEKRDPAKNLDLWNKLYESKENENLNPNEKHSLYYFSFRQLGFFDKLEISSRILQIGIGHGKTLRRIIEEEVGLTAYGIDISFLALLNLKRKTRISNLVTADALNIPFPDNSFDRVFEVGVVEHFYQNDPFEGNTVDRELIIKSLLELKRILRQDGKVGFIQPSKYSTLPLSQKMDQLLGNWCFRFQENFSINDFSQLLAIAGFRNIRYCILQAPDDFPLRIRVGDRILKSFYTLTGQYRKAELVGALFCMVAEK